MTHLVESVDVAGATVSALKADAQLTALVDAARIYQEIVPSTVIWPFIKLGPFTDTPVRHDVAGAGAKVIGSVHVFAKATQAHPDPAKFCKTVNRHVARVLEALDGATIAGEPALSVHVTQAQEIQDGAESSARHGFVLFAALVC